MPLPRRLCPVLVVLLALLLLPSVAQAGFDPQITVAPSGADPYGYPSDIGFDRAGVTTVETVSGAQVLVYTRPPGGSFSGGSIGSGTKASMAVSADGQAVTAWKASSTSVQVAYRSGSGAGFSSVASFTGSAVGNVAAGIDANGNAVVAWKDGAIHYATSTGATFGAAQSAPLGANPGFDGRGSDPQRDHGPRAFRDNAGNVLLAYRDGSDATIAHRAPDGTWDPAVVLPSGASSSDLQADADPTSQRLIVGYTAASTFRAFEGSTASTTGTIRVDQASSQDIMSVAVQRGGAEDLALWRSNTNELRSASSLDGFTPATVAPSVGGGVGGAITSGDDLVAYFAAPDGFGRASRQPGGAWTNLPHVMSNFGTAAVGSGYNGDAFGLFVDYPNDTAITGFPYSGAASPPGGKPPTGPGSTAPPAGQRRPTGTTVSCNYAVADAADTCIATVGDGGAPPRTTPSGTVAFTTRSGGFFSFGSTCALRPTTGSPGVASCTVQFIPPAAGGFPQIAAAYRGDATHAPSAGHTQFIIAAVPGTGQASCCASCHVAAETRAPADAGPQGPVGKLVTTIAMNRPAAQRAAFSCLATIAAISGGSIVVTGWVAKIVGPYAVSAAGNPELIPVVLGYGEAADLAAGSVAATAGLLTLLANDPPDSHFRTIAIPRVPHPALISTRGRLRGVKRQINGVLRVEARLAATLRALGTSRNRASGAHRARQRKWERRQMLAVARYSGRAASLLGSLTRMSKQLAAAARRTKLGKPLFGTRAITNFLRDVARHGLPRGLVALLRRFGATDRDLRTMTQNVLTTSPRQPARTVGGALVAPNLLTNYRRAARVLGAYAKRVARHPSATQS